MSVGGRGDGVSMCLFERPFMDHDTPSVKLIVLSPKLISRTVEANLLKHASRLKSDHLVPVTSPESLYCFKMYFSIALLYMNYSGKF